jgi:hypothetical protein
MSGKSRNGGISSASRYSSAAAEETSGTVPTTAAAVATEAAVQASWTQYVQNLVSEQIAVIRGGVIGGLVEFTNEELDRLFDEANRLLRRELDGNSAKLEAALAEIRAAKAEMREEIRSELWGHFETTRSPL